MEKMIRIIVSVVMVCHVCSSAPASGNAAPKKPWNSNDTQSLALSSLTFAWDAYRALDVAAGQNVFYSPYSISNAVAMLILGSKGELEAELREALRVPSPASGTGSGGASRMHEELSAENERLSAEKDATIGVANRFFVKQDLVSKVDAEYRADLKRIYKSDLEPTPFAENPEQAKKLVNDFVSEKTNGELPQFLDKPPDSMTMLMLVNAVYFKAMWTTPFEEQLTKAGPFHARKGDVTVDFMSTQSSLEYAHSDELRAQMIVLPYTETESYAFCVIVPDEGQSLSSLEASLDDEKIRHLGTQLRFKNVELKLPKFSMKNRFELKSLLEKMGAVGLSTPRDATNSRIFADSVEGAFVDSVIHEAKIEVNENGTVAAAGTSIGVAFSSLPFYKPVTLNRPFLFFILDTSNQFTLFWGRLEDPSSAQ